jgi:tetratricopeptide (TPR) repeat protein
MAVDADEAELWKQANTAESENRFSDAAAIWRQIRESLARRLGEQHWQVANCDMAIQADERLAALTADERILLDALRKIEAQVAQLSQAGAYRRALVTLNQAHPLAARLFGEKSLIPVRLRLMASQLAQQIKEWPVAQSELEVALGLAERLIAPPHPDLETICFQLGMVAREQDDLEQSIEWLQRSRDMSDALNASAEIRAERANELGVSLHRASQTLDAIREFSAAEKLWRGTNENPPFRLAECLVNQAVALMAVQQWSNAEAKLIEAESLLANESREVRTRQDIWLHQATVHVTRQEFPQAVERLRLALDAEERTTGKLQPHYAHIAYRLGMCLAFQRDFENAEPHLRHALEVQGNLLGQSHADTLRTAKALAMLLERTERSVEAQELNKRFAYTSGDATPPPSQ